MTIIEGSSNGVHTANQIAETVRTVAVCDTQPAVMEGVRTILGGSPDLEFVGASDSLERAMELVARPTSCCSTRRSAFRRFWTG